MNTITDRQRLVLDFIRRSTLAKGYPPTVREIGNHFGIRSTNGVNDHIHCLIRKGFLVRTSMTSRGLRLTDSSPPQALPVPEEGERVELIQVPVLRRIRAGKPLVDPNEILDTYTMPADELPGEGMLFALRMQSDAMVGDGIVPGDDVFFRTRTGTPPSNTLCAVLLGDEAVMRRVVYQDGSVYFAASNSAISRIVLRAAHFSGKMILGTAVRLFRPITPGKPCS